MNININNNLIKIDTKNDITYLKFKKLDEFNIEHAFYIGKKLDFKTSNKDNYKNYDAFLSLFNLDYKKCIKPIYTHSANYKKIDKKYNVNEPDFNIYKNTDALITNKNNLILISTSADCNIILIYDYKKEVIANIHSGWRGTLDNIVINTIKGMKKEYNSDYKDLICCILPSIRLCCFEVEDDVYLTFKNKYNLDKYYHKIDNKRHIDLVSIIKDNLINIGVNKDNIIDCDICSMCNSNLLHSYRCDKENFKVSASFICLRSKDYD